MSTVYSTESQMNFVLQWFKGWSEIQKEDFVKILAKKLKEEDEDSEINNLANGIKGMGRPPSLFACQIKLFNEWWGKWTKEDRDNMNMLFDSEDSKFTQDVEVELKGGKGKLNEDFMIVQNQNGESVEMEKREEKSPVPVFNVTKVVLNGLSSFNSVTSENGEEEKETRAEGIEEEGMRIVVNVEEDGEVTEI